MAPKSTIALILDKIIEMAKDLAVIKNGMGQKVEKLWAWKEEYPTRCNFLVWLQEHPEMSPQVEKANRGRKRLKNDLHSRRRNALLLVKDIVLALAAIWGVGRGFKWW